MTKKLILFLFVLSTFTIQAQLRYDTYRVGKLQLPEEQLTDDEEEIPEGRGFTFALNLGMVFPNKYTANFYNGSDKNPNKASRILLNPYYKPYIVELIGHQYDSSDIDLPQDMAYQIAINIGFFARWSPNTRNGFFLQFSYQKLQTNGIFLIHWKLDYPTNKPSYTTAYIMGEEERNCIDIGYIREWPLSSLINLYMETGLNMTNTIVLKNMIQVEGQEYSIKYDGEHPLGPYSTNYTYDFQQGGIGFGAFFGSGIRLIFSEKITVDPGITFYWKKINLEGYEQSKPDFTAMVRLTIKDPFW